MSTMGNMPEKQLHIKSIELNYLLHKDKKKYPFNISVIKNFKKLAFNKPVTFIIGENGSGKSTFLEAIAIASGLDVEGGGKNKFSQKRVLSELNRYSRLFEYLWIEKSANNILDTYFLRAESLYNVASKIDERSAMREWWWLLDSYGGKSLHEQSHGESFLAILQNHLKGNGFYIFDEPEAALSPKGLLKLLVLIDTLVNKNSQFIISTHSPIVMAYPNAEIYEINNGKMELMLLEDTKHFSITKYFMMNPKKMIAELGITVPDAEGQV